MPRLAFRHRRGRARSRVSAPSLWPSASCRPNGTSSPRRHGHVVLRCRNSSGPVRCRQPVSPPSADLVTRHSTSRFPGVPISVQRTVGRERTPRAGRAGQRARAMPHRPRCHVRKLETRLPMNPLRLRIGVAGRWASGTSAVYADCPVRCGRALARARGCYQVPVAGEMDRTGGVERTGHRRVLPAIVGARWPDVLGRWRASGAPHGLA